MNNTEQIPSSEAEGHASQEILNNILYNQNATTNPFQSGVEHTSEDTPSSNTEVAVSRVRFEESSIDKDIQKTLSPSGIEDTTEEKRQPTQTQHYNNLRQIVSERKI